MHYIGLFVFHTTSSHLESLKCKSSLQPSTKNFQTRVLSHSVLGSSIWTIASFRCFCYWARGTSFPLCHRELYWATYRKEEQTIRLEWPALHCLWIYRVLQRARNALLRKVVSLWMFGGLYGTLASKSTCKCKPSKVSLCTRERSVMRAIWYITSGLPSVHWHPSSKREATRVQTSSWSLASQYLGLSPCDWLWQQACVSQAV